MYVLNSEVFGQAIRRERGPRTQTKIAESGGPYRQLQAKIERGDGIELTATVLAKYDTAFEWTPGTAATILRATVATTTSRAADDGTLGHDAITGQPIDIPRRLTTALPPEQLIPVIAAWPGVAVVDTEVFDLSAQRDAVRSRSEWPKWRGVTTGPTVDQLVSRWKAASPDRAVVGVGVIQGEAERVAIDPVPALTNSTEALALIHAVEGLHATIPEGTYSYQVAWTLLFLACQPHRPARSAGVRTEVLTVDKPLLPPEATAFEPFEVSWQEFFPPESVWFEPTLDVAAGLLAGLKAARTNSITIDLDKSTKPAISIYAGPSVVLPQRLSDATMVLHNSDISPELPAVIAWAVRRPVLVVARDPAPTLVGPTDSYVIEVSSQPYADEQPVAAAERGTALLARIPGAQYPLLTFAAEANEQSANVVLRTSGVDE